MEPTKSHTLKQALARRYRLWTGLAICLDAVLVFGPSVFESLERGYPVLFSRWLVMIIGVPSIVWAYREERFDFNDPHWLTTYLVFGFTLAAVLNGLGTLRLWDW